MKRELSANTNLSHYRIVSKIGEGGMGEVYLAEDSRLRRKVALKILPSEMAANQGRMRRFKQEATTAAALNHPNIAHIYEIGESSGTNFIAMEFVEGVTLREKIHRERTELSKLLRYLQHGAEGLAKAHAAGIVHRDLKPDNIMVTRDGHAKILDFGLAKLIEPQLAETPNAQDYDEAATAILQQQSTPGVIMGTVGYMSPEQAQGKANEIDQRSDIFSFGCILFEAVTGKKPFASDSIVKSLHSLIYEPAPQIKDLNPAAPADLQRIIRRCLAKDKEERYQTIKDVAIELKELRRDLDSVTDSTVPSAISNEGAFSTDSGGSIEATAIRSASLPPTVSSAEFVAQGLKRHKLGVAIALVILIAAVAFFAYYLPADKSEVAIDSIAVLPFQNRSSDADTEYLSDGLAESLIYRLSQLPNLKVSPTSSVIRYKGKDTDLAQIAKELEVDAVMSGRVSQRGDDLTISVELVDARTKKIIWAEQYDRKMADLLATQREISTTITQKLQLKLTGEDTKGITKAYTKNNEAYQLYLKGRYHFARRTKGDILKSIGFFQEATQLDADFALAYSSIAECYTVMPSHAHLSPKEASPKAKEAVQKALEIDPSLAEAHAILGNIITNFDWDWAEAEREYRRALELNPNSATSHYRYGQHLAGIGKLDKAIEHLSRAIELEPLSGNNNATLALVYMYAGQNEKGLQLAKQTYELDPSVSTTLLALGSALNVNGRYDDAVRLSENILQSDPANQHMLMVAGNAYGLSGRRQVAEEIIQRFRELAKAQYVSNGYIASIFAALRQKDQAFAELETAFQQRDWWVTRLKVDPIFAPLRSDPRFQAMLKRLNLPE